MHKIRIDGETLTIEDVVKVARENAEVEVPDAVRERVRKTREVLQKLIAKGHTIYGVNTGFGALSSFKIRRRRSNASNPI